MNKEMMKQCGFEKEVKEVEAHICPFCHKPVDMDELAKSDETTRREFQISGICPKCQKEFFGY